MSEKDEKDLPPLICIRGPEGQMLFTALEKGPNGNWEIPEPEKIRQMLGLDETTPDQK